VVVVNSLHRSDERDSTATGADAVPVEPTVLSTRQLYAPMQFAVAYLGGTYLLFLLIGQVTLVPDLVKLTAFVTATVAAVGAGYHLKARTYSRRVVVPVVDRAEVGNVRTWVLLSAAYFAAFGLALLLSYGATGPADIVRAIADPGAAYFAKFRVYEAQQAAGERNLLIQGLTLMSVLYTPLIPFTVVYWKHLTRAVRLAAVGGAVVYCCFFVFIGTMKGFGDLLVFGLASYLAMAVGNRRKVVGPHRPRRLLVSVILVLSAFVTYMAFNQAARVAEAGIAERFPPNPVVSAVTGEEFARGLSVISFYPTHGYLGLGHNLDTSFEWTAGLGSSRALDSYWVQYVGGEGASHSTYPARTEMRTGWPAGQYWATIYPWLASDLTFPGAVFLMGVVGWFLARFWYESAFERKRLSLLLFCQLGLLIAFVPANNQLGTGRTSLIAFVSLVVAYRVNLTLVRARRS
jgi:hypothetical protein